MTDLNYGCDIVNVFQNITNNCSDDISVAEDQCKLFCIISVMKGIDMCSGYLFEAGLLTQMKDLIKYCVYKKYALPDGH